MVGWMSLLTAVFTFGTQVFKYLREREESNQNLAKKMRNAKDAIKKARKTKDTSDIEAAFGDLGFVDRSKLSDISKRDN